MSNKIGDAWVEIGADDKSLVAGLARSETKVRQFASSADVNVNRVSRGFGMLGAAAGGFGGGPMMRAASSVNMLSMEFQSLIPLSAAFGGLAAGWTAGKLLDQTFGISENLSKMIAQSKTFGNFIEQWSTTRGNAFTSFFKTLTGSKDQVSVFSEGEANAAKIRAAGAAEQRERLRKEEAIEKIRQGVRPNELIKRDKYEQENYLADQVKKIGDIRKAMFWEDEAKEEKERQALEKTKDLGGTRAEDINRVIQEQQRERNKPATVAERKAEEQRKEQIELLKKMTDELEQEAIFL